MNEVLALLILLSVVGGIVAVVTPNLLYSVISVGAVGFLLLTACHEREVHFAQSNSMAAQLTLIRALYIILASRTKDEEIEEIGGIEKIVNSNLRVR